MSVGREGVCFGLRDLGLRVRETYWKSSVIHARGNGYRDKEGTVMEMADGAVVVKFAMDRLEKICNVAK